MKSTTEREWLYLAAFVAFGCAAFGVYYVFAERLASPGSYRVRYSRSDKPDYGTPARGVTSDKVLLPRDEPIVVNGQTLVYRGIEDGGRIRVDVVIRDLDPEKAYAYRFDAQAAHGGFQVAGRRWKLVDVNPRRLRLSALEEKEPR